MTSIGGAGDRMSPALPRSTGMAIVELDKSHLPDAARLFADGYGRLRRAVPALPASYLDGSATVAPLTRLLAAGSSGRVIPAVAAIRDGRLAGYMASMAAPGLRGSGTAAYVPEWAHAVAGPDRAATFAALYGALSVRWVERGWLVHCCSILAGDRELRDELAWLGFGLFVVDALRGIDGPMPAAPVAVPAGATIGQATAGDLDELLELDLASEAYYAGAPIFLHRDVDDDPRGALAIRLTSPGQSVWIARSGPASRIASFIYLRPPAEDVCRLVRDRGTISICGAFTTPEARGGGLAQALVAAVVAWARESGYERVGVDFESANRLARRFWLRSFEPVCLSFDRHLDDRFGKATAGVEP
jgi:GNAT superfamily N-acetyltransferase